MTKRGDVVLGVALSLTIGITAVAQQGAIAPKPSPGHKKLAAFAGTWNDEAEIKPGPLGSGGKMSLTETCEWFTGGFSLICHTEEQVYRSYDFNSVGQSGAAKGTVDGDTWTFDGESKIDGKLIKTRYTIQLPSPDSAVLKAEASVAGGPMTFLMELKGTRVKQSLSNSNSCVHGASEGWPFECFQNLLTPPRG
jgi:hypothetical protein